MFFFRPTPLTPETTGPRRLGKDCGCLAGVSASAAAGSDSTFVHLMMVASTPALYRRQGPARAWILMGRINLIDSSSGGTNSQDVLLEIV